MKSLNRASGVRLLLPDDVDVGARAGDARRSAPTGRVWGTISLSDDKPPADDDPVVRALLGQEMRLVDEFSLNGAARDSRRSAEAPEPPPAVVAKVETRESAAVLFEKDGIYSWGIKRETSAAPAERRGDVAGAEQLIVFEAPAELLSVGVPAKDRALPGLGTLVGAVRVWVFKFAAPILIGTGIRVLERHVRKRILAISSKDPSTWAEVAQLASLPNDRPPRILLFVHGTFSSTAGSFGALAASPWGRMFLDDAAKKYDAIIGYDHPTLSEDPLENAADLLARLERLLPRPARFDAVAFSRGALVLRSLVELLLPSHPTIGRIERAVFVGSTNAGTELARSTNWKRLVDLYTNLVVAGCDVIKQFGATTIASTILEESIRTIGALVKALADSAIDGGKIPGLAAMSPDGEFVTEINRAQPGQPTAAEVFYSVVTSSFDVHLAKKDASKSLPAHLLQWLLDTLGDQLLGEPNDLVVHTASMSAIDRGHGDYVKSRHEFGSNPHVYHTVYFTRPETVSHIRTWLELDGAVTTTARATRAAPPPPSVGTSISVRDSDRLIDVLARIAADNSLSVVVGSAGAPASQTYRTTDIIDASRGAADDAPLRDVIVGGPTILSRDVALPSMGDLIQSARSAPAPQSAPDAPRDSSKRRVRSAPRRSAPSRSADVPERGPGAPGEGISWRGLGTPKEESAPVATSPRSLVDCYLGASMPGVVAVGATVDVQVSLSLDAIQLPTGTVGSTAIGSVATDEEIEVTVVPKKRFSVGSDRVERVTLSEAQRTSRFTFAVTATEAGDGELWVIASQQGRTIARIALAPKVELEAPARAEAIGANRTAPLDTSGPPDDLLQIFENVKSDDAWELLFVLSLSGKRAPIRGRTPTITRSRRMYVEGLFKEIEAMYEETAAGDQAASDRLRAFGEDLLNELVPENIREALWDNRDKLTGIQVVSEDPFIPWELVYLIPRRKGFEARPDGVFLAELGLVRWLHEPAVEPPVEIHVAAESVYYVIPDYAPPAWKLPEAQEEITFLTKELGAKPIVARSADVIAALRKPDTISIFHFSGHGIAPTEEDEKKFGEALMTLAGSVADGNQYLPDYLSARVVDSMAQLSGPRGRRPMVMLNACQLGRFTSRLYNVGGFTPAFMRAGAGVFIAALWSIGDSPARVFSEAFYQAFIKDRKILAEAVKIGREAARKSAPDTWLSYAIYGHPYARVVT